MEMFGYLLWAEMPMCWGWHVWGYKGWGLGMWTAEESA